jgi:WD40 repeat protein
MGYATVFSFDERNIFTAEAGDNVAQLLNIESGAEIARLRHDGAVLSAAFLPDQNKMVTASSDGKLRTWEMPHPNVKVHEYGEKPQAISFSPNGRHLAVVEPVDWRHDSRTVLRVWDTETDFEFSEKMDTGEHDAISIDGTIGDAVSVSDNGARVAAVGYWGKGRVAEVWDSKDRQRLLSITCQSAISTILVSGDGQYVAASCGTTIELWDVGMKEQVHRIEVPREKRLMLGPEGTFVVAEKKEGDALHFRVFLWSTGHETTRFNLKEPNACVRKIVFSSDKIVFSPDGRWIACAGTGVRVYSAETGELVHSLVQQFPTSLVFDPSAKFLATSSGEGIIRIWDVDKEQEVFRAYHRGHVPSIAFSNGGRFLATANGYRTLQQGRTAVNVANEARLWYWQAGDIVSFTCDLLRRNRLREGLVEDAERQFVCPESRHGIAGLSR